jgi:redox-sensitive bicupin YhaK (pirin superfamily)
MFPLLDPQNPNPLELFQIWLNLPAAGKMADPHFTMFWSQDIPRLAMRDATGGATEVAVIAGRLAEAPRAPLTPPPDSWAAQADADVAIWTVRMAPGACWTLPAATGNGTQRQLYFFKGTSVTVGGEPLTSHAAITLRADAAVKLTNTGSDQAEFLMLQGKPIGEPVVQYGPFVMNTQAEIAQTLADYQRTQFGGWSFADDAPVHGREPARFARYPGGREEKPAEAGAGTSFKDLS